MHKMDRFTDSICIFILRIITIEGRIYNCERANVKKHITLKAIARSYSVSPSDRSSQKLFLAMDVHTSMTVTCQTAHTDTIHVNYDACDS